MRDRRLQSIEAIVERQQSMPAEGDDDRLLLDRQHGRSRLSWTGLEIRRRAPSLPLGHRLLVDAVALSQSPQALLMGWTAPAPAPFLRQARCHHGPFRGAPSMRKQHTDLSAAVTVGLDLAAYLPGSRGRRLGRCAADESHQTSGPLALLRAATAMPGRA